MTKKRCEICGKEIDCTLDDLVDHGWSAFQISAGNGKVRVFCDEHQNEMRQEMERTLQEEKKRLHGEIKTGTAKDIKDFGDFK